MSIEVNSPNFTGIQYPVARKSQRTGAVILFTDSQHGMCIQVGTSGNYVGEVLDSWIRADDMGCWEPVEVIIKG